MDNSCGDYLVDLARKKLKIKDFSCSFERGSTPPDHGHDNAGKEKFRPCSSGIHR